MANLALALDEIISQSKPVKRAGVRRSGRVIRSKAMETVVEGPRTSARTRFPQKGFVSGVSYRFGLSGHFTEFSLSFFRFSYYEVPAGRWKHDKFFETYGAKKGAAQTLGILTGKRERIPQLAAVRKGGGIGARLARKSVGNGQSGIVKMQILSLPKTVLTSDLEELFQEYNCYGVTVHYDELGNHLGSADLFTDQKTAAEIIREFKDIAIDGQEIKFCIVAESGTTTSAAALGAEKPSIRDRLRRVSGNTIQRRRVVKKAIGVKAGAAGRKARLGKKAVVSPGKLRAKTAEELDMELSLICKRNNRKMNEE
ncbi:FoP_duplication domain-containing protein [Meloidogyne graminicola]|uniref:FoP_duplication domain-containing protein n=1 Tax=Meloidogyne graminicola TaxID=189291 RepID=A0A8S9ZFU7_9BILA|nr:FoP_duplication domain-containing protein [Meloidogyne graminicola]